MRRSSGKLLWLTIAVLAQVATGQQILRQSELKAVIQQITKNPRQTWLGQGSLRVVHTRYQAPAIVDEQEMQAKIKEEIELYTSNTDKAQKTDDLQARFLEAIPFNTRYDLQNESTTVSTEYIQFSGNRFHREVVIDSHDDSVTPPPAIAQNVYTHTPDLATNRRRIFSYNGQRAYQYFKSVNLAIEEDASGNTDIPRSLMAGLIPWGTGIFTRKSILNSQPSATTQSIDGSAYIHLEFHHELASVSALLDPSKSMAVLDCTITRSSGNMITNMDLSQYIQVDGRWIPASIYIEQHVPDNTEYRLRMSEHWQLDILDSSRPSTTDFSPQYDEGAWIKYFSPQSRGALHYSYRSDVDTDDLLTQRLFTLDDNRPQNCASVAIEYIARKLDTPLTESPSTMIDDTGSSSLYDMKHFLKRQGLHAEAIKTTVEKLARYDDYYIIVHIPRLSHYVIVENVDSQNVWTIDLTSNDFYTSYSRDLFQNEWTEGNALLVAKQGITTTDEPIDNIELQAISAGTGLQCVQMQDMDILYCDITPGGICMGMFEIYFRFSLCQPATSGTCEDDRTVLVYDRDYCYNDPVIPGVCRTVQGFTYTIQGCAGLTPR